MIEIRSLRRSAQRLGGSTGQNHALVHATLAMFLRRAENPLRVMGRAMPNGLCLLAGVSTEKVEIAAGDALRRTCRGEEYLAVSPFCGTNSVIVGVLSSLKTIAVVGTREGISKLPTAFTLATREVLEAQLRGALAQRCLTTFVDVADLNSVRVTRTGPSSRIIDKVDTAREEAPVAAVRRIGREGGLTPGLCPRSSSVAVRSRVTMEAF